MKVKHSKCEFHKEETKYLGFIINREGIKTDPVKTQVIWDWKTPKNKTDIQSFLGFCNFYRRFIEGFSRNAKTTTTHWQDMEGQRKLLNWSADNTTGRGYEKLSKDTSEIAIFVNGVKWSDTHHTEC